ncbi:MAG TPA: hypothetical protein VGG46_10245 [Terriglobales bacterium]|jgi:hypothetical protein
MNKMKMRFFVVLLISISSLFCAPAVAQFPRFSIPKISLGNDIPFDLMGKQPISTSFADTDQEVSLPDSFSPQTYTPLASMNVGPHGGYLLQPGAYEAVVESFCLHAGTHGPSSGDGYLYAPLKGAKAEIIQSILRGVAQHRDVPQPQIQTLIWAIEARAKLENLSPTLQLVAAELLTKKELLDLNGGALGLVPGAVWDKALQSAPPEARNLLQVEAEIRSKLASADSSFADIEKIAILAGPANHDGISVPRGRWASHPGGFFVRYLPDGYTKMKIQVYVPAHSARNGGARTLFGSFVTVGAFSVEFDPTGDVAMPADTGAQRLGLTDAQLYSGDDPRHGHYGQADGPTPRDACNKATSECTSTLNCPSGSKIQILGGKDCAGFCSAGGTSVVTCQRFCKCTGGGLPVSQLDLDRHRMLD